LCIDFLPEDLEYLSSKGLHNLVHSLHSVDCKLRSAVADKKALIHAVAPVHAGKLTGRVGSSWIAWKPWVPSVVADFVKQGKLSGRRVLRHMLSEPAALHTRVWWVSHLDVRDWHTEDAE